MYDRIKRNLAGLLIEVFNDDRFCLDDMWDAKENVEDIAELLIVKGINAPVWIPSKEILPSGIEEYYQQYGEYPEFNVMIEGGRIPTTLFFDGEGWFDTANEYYKVTHWLPLPPAPGVCNV